MNLMNLKDKINQNTEESDVDPNNKETEVNDQSKANNKSSNRKRYDFDLFKKEVKKLLKNDNVLIRMKLSVLEKDSYLIIFQGVRSNVKARFYPHKYSVNVNLIKKRLSKPINKLYHQ